MFCGTLVPHKFIIFTSTIVTNYLMTGCSLHAHVHEVSCDVFISCREEISERYGGKLSTFMEGRLYEVFSRIMRVLVGRKIIIPGSFKR